MASTLQDLDRMEKWTSNMRKRQQATAEEIYRLLKEVKKNVKVDCSFNPAVGFCQQLREEDCVGGFAKCLACEKRKLLLELDVKVNALRVEPYAEQNVEETL